MRISQWLSETTCAATLLLGACAPDRHEQSGDGTVEAGWVGLWQGLAEFEGSDTRVEFALSEKEGGGLSAVMHLRDLGVLDYAVQVERTGRNIVVGAPPLFSFEGAMRKDGATLAGSLRTADTSVAVVLEKNNPAFRRFGVPRLTEAGEVDRRYRYEQPVETRDGWPVSTLAAESIDVRAIESLVTEVFRGEHGHAETMVIVRHGNLVLDEYFHGFTRDRPHSIQSITKSVTSLLFGIAKDRGLIGDVSQLVYTFFPEYAGRKWIDERYDITLAHLLTMSAAIDWNERIPYSDPNNSNTAMNASGDWIGYVLERGRAGSPGRSSSYASGLSILVGGVIKNATGKYVDEFAEETLFKDLGIGAYRWFAAPDGTRHTGGGLSVTARDLAKIGQLVIDEGTWNGQRVVSAEWVRESVRRHLPLADHDGAPNEAYGYQWWHQTFRVDGRALKAIAGLGYGGQYLGIFPALELVVILNAGEYVDGSKRKFDYNAIVEDGILPAVR